MALRSAFRNFRGLTKLINQNQELSSKNFRIFCTKATTAPVLNKKEVTVTFVRPNGDRINAKGKVGESLLDVVVNNNIDLDGFGACEGTLTCSTCHLIFKKKDFDQLPDKATEEELDMLDLAYDLTDTSRLGCQIILSEKMDGLEVEVPATINDMRDS